MTDLVVKPEYLPDGEFGYGGRYPDSSRQYEPGSLDHDRLTRISMLPDLLASDDPMDRVRAHVYLREITATVPAFVVVETAESPNLRRDGERMLESRMRQRMAWSAHLDEADAQAWRDDIQRRADAQRAKHPWWGPESARIFGVEHWDHAPVYALRQPGADPRRHCTAFS